MTKKGPKRNAILEFYVVRQIQIDSVSHNQSNKKMRKFLGTCSINDSNSVYYNEI